VAAGPEGEDLFIRVVQTGGGTQDEFAWSIMINNPTDRAVTTSLSSPMNLPGIRLPDKPITVEPGACLVVQR